uniref:Putative poly-A polymerase domain containing protein n=1 Tax=viral metagenome TaxID=1070528 RepID=A0A6M3IRT4_9ZZZZ
MRFTSFINEAVEMVKQWNDYVSKNSMLKNAIKVLKNIESKKYKAFLVGGCVRDIILGIDFKDIDIATNIPIKELEKIYKTHDIGKSKTFGIVVVREGGDSFEVAQFREDGKYEDGRRPEKVTFNVQLKDDLSRRDLTINACAISSKGEIIDYFDGKKDIKNKVLKTVGNPYDRFSEDFLRIMRTARFSAKLGFDIEKDTKKAATKLSPNILKMSPERIKEELFKSAGLGGKKFAIYLKILDEMKILKLILPELVASKYINHNLEHHPEGLTVWNHVMAALESTGTMEPIKVLSIALHDIGKTITLSHKEGLPKYFRHAEMGIKMGEDIANRLKMSNDEKGTLIFAIANHMKFKDILKMKQSKIVKLVNDDNWDVLVSVCMADEFSRGEKFMHTSEFEKIVDKAIEIKNKWGIPIVNKTMKLVDGNHIMELTGLKPGKKVGEIKAKTIEWIVDNDIKDSNEIDKYILSLK